MENKIKKYNNLDYTYTNVTYNNYVSDKYNIIHNKLYEDALNKYLKEEYQKLNDEEITFEDYKSKFNFIELKDKEYFLPSIVIIKEIEYPFKSKKIDLSKYWNQYEESIITKKFNNEFYTDDIDINHYEIIYINNVQNTVKLQNKITGKIIYKDLNYLNENNNLHISNDLSLSNTFSYKLQNKIYGE